MNQKIIYKFLLTISLASLSSFALIPKAFGQERPKCYIIDNSGELTDLTDICNASQKQLSEDFATNDGQNAIDNINVDSKSVDTDSSSGDSIRVLGNNFDRESGSIDAIYYLDNEIGSNYTAYVRSYKAPSTSIDRRTLRERAFRFGANRSLTSTLRHGREVPFIIYRY